MNELEDLRDAVRDLSEGALLTLIAVAAALRGPALREEVAPTGEVMLVPGDAVIEPMPENERDFWNALAAVLAAERDRRRRSGVS